MFCYRHGLRAHCSFFFRIAPGYSVSAFESIVTRKAHKSCGHNLFLHSKQGLVEKWLKEVQTLMLESVLAQMKMSYDNYWLIKRGPWLLKWPGQMIQTMSQLIWTKEVVHCPVVVAFAFQFQLL